jgi:hypothetical protein
MDKISPAKPRRKLLDFIWLFQLPALLIVKFLCNSCSKAGFTGIEIERLLFCAEIILSLLIILGLLVVF